MVSSVPTFTSLVGVEHPIIQVPMNGGSPVVLTASVANAGALGSFAAALHTPDVIISKVNTLRTMTARPFNVNLFVLDQAQPIYAEVANAKNLLAPFRKQLGLDPATVPRK